MRFQKKIFYSLIISSITLITSIILPIIPCRTAPKVPNPIYQWNLCALNPDTAVTSTHIQEYFGYTSSLTDSYFLLLLITFAVIMIFFHFTTRRRIKE